MNTYNYFIVLIVVLIVVLFIQRKYKVEAFVSNNLTGLPTTPFQFRSVGGWGDVNTVLDDGGATCPGGTIDGNTCIMGTYTNKCYSGGLGHSNQTWQYDPNTKLLRAAYKNNLCLDSLGWSSNNRVNSWLWACDPNNGNQTWEYDVDVKRLRKVGVTGANGQPVYLDHSGGNKQSKWGWENSNVQLQCPNGQAISGGNITYGAWWRFASMPLPQNCIGNNSCWQPINNNIGMGDPFPGWYKNGRIDYTCKADGGGPDGTCGVSHYTLSEANPRTQSYVPVPVNV
jgi:hypothetical protein